MLALLYLAGLLAPQTPSVPTFPAAVALVTVDAVVLDEKGQPVAGLTRDDFVVTEDGRPQEIVGFEAFGAEAGTATDSTAAPAPPDAPGEAPRGARAFGIVLDDLRLSPSTAEAARRAATAFLERSLTDGDEVTLGTTSGTAWWSARLPEGREDLLAVLAQVKGRYVEATSLDRMSDYEAYWINSYESGPPHHAPVPDRTGADPGPEARGAASGDSAGSSRRGARQGALEAGQPLHRDVVRQHGPGSRRGAQHRKEGPRAPRPRGGAAGRGGAHGGAGTKVAAFPVRGDDRRVQLRDAGAGGGRPRGQYRGLLRRREGPHRPESAAPPPTPRPPPSPRTASP